MTSRQKAIDLVKKMRFRQNQLFEQSQFCKEHSFNLESQMFQRLEDEVRKLAYMIEDAFNLPYIPLNQATAPTAAPQTPLAEIE